MKKLFAAIAIAVAIGAPAAMADTMAAHATASPAATKAHAMKGDHMAGHAMKGDHMAGHAMKGDHMAGHAMKGDHMGKPSPTPTREP